MDLMQQQQLFAGLTPQQRDAINYYHDNNMAMLRKICDPIIYRKGVPPMDYDELYDVASDTLLESLGTYDESKGSQFNTYLRSNINRAFYDWTRDRRRAKRCNVLMENGKIVKDEDGNPIVIPDIPIDAPTEDGIDMCEKIASSFNLEAELAEEIGLSSGSKMDKYLNMLSKKQRRVAVYLSEGYKPPEIREILHITEKEYADCIKGMQSYEYIKILL